jgi:hypothetical protein
MPEPRLNLRWNSIMAMEWKNYDDFMEKYGWENNPDLAEDRVNLFRMINLRSFS